MIRVVARRLAGLGLQQSISFGNVARVCGSALLASSDTVAISGSSDPLDEKLRYSVCTKDYKWVERLLPPSKVPYPPTHASYPTPSGWCPPSETKPDKPYFVRRSRLHTLPIYETTKPKRSKRFLTIIKNIDGDVMALEKELVDVVKPYLTFDPATRVNEATGTIWVKGLHKEAIEKYLYDQGF